MKSSPRCAAARARGSPFSGVAITDEHLISAEFASEDKSTSRRARMKVPTHQCRKRSAKGKGGWVRVRGRRNGPTRLGGQGAGEGEGAGSLDGPQVPAASLALVVSKNVCRRCIAVGLLPLLSSVSVNFSCCA